MSQWNSACQHMQGDEGWYQLTTVLSYYVLKRIQTPHNWFSDFWAADWQAQTQGIFNKLQVSSSLHWQQPAQEENVPLAMLTQF